MSFGDEVLSDDETNPLYGVLAARCLLDHSVIHLLPWGCGGAQLSIGGGLGYWETYCFHDRRAAWAAFATWDGTSEPAAWARNPFTGRRGPCTCPDCERERKLPWNQPRVGKDGAAR